MSNSISRVAHPALAPACEQHVTVADVVGSDARDDRQQVMSGEEFRQLGVPDVGYIRQVAMFGHPPRFIIYGADGIPVVLVEDLSQIMEFAVYNGITLLPLQ